MAIAGVVLTNSTIKFDKCYHYIVPENLKEAIHTGCRVLVPFGKSDKKVEAFVIEIVEQTDYDILKMKEISEVLDCSILLNKDLLELAIWMKDRYFCTYGSCIKTILPSGITLVSAKVVTLLKEPEKLTGNTKKVVQTLKDNDNELKYTELEEILEIRNLTQCIKKLEQEGCIKIEEKLYQRAKEKFKRAVVLAKPADEIAEEIEQGSFKKIQQIKVLEMLMENQRVYVSDFLNYCGVSRYVLDTLCKNGYLEYVNVEEYRDPFEGKDYLKTEPLQPNEEQREIINLVSNDILTKNFNQTLLFGITGSGKTEVYLQIIQEAIRNGRDSIVLVPEISLTPQMVERFKGRFGDKVAVLHSRLSMGERYDQWNKIRTGEVKVAIGARSAVFAPFSNLGLIIIDEEHETSYKSETVPKYHARDIAEFRCRQNNAVMILGSATPSIESYYKAETGKYRLLKLNNRAVKSASLPCVELIDMRKELDNGNRSMFSFSLQKALMDNLKNNSQSMLFINRRGYSSFVMCRNCGFVIKCVDCNVAMTYHSNHDRLICHYCGYTVRNPQTCPNCGSKYIRQFGTGTQRVEEEVKKLDSGISTIRMDMDTTTGKNGHEQILNLFKNNNINVMIGTQMIAKGHDFPNVTLVGVIAADSLLFQGDYTASERTFQIITQVSGRAGRADKSGKVIVQTYNVDDYSIQAACRQDYQGFYRQEISLRQKLDYPPFNNIGVVIVSSNNDRTAFASANAIYKNIASKYIEEKIFKPARPAISRIRKKYRWRIIIKDESVKKLLDIFKYIDTINIKNEAKISVSYDINPTSLA